MDRLSQLWKRLNPNQKLLFGTLSAAFVVLVISLAVWAGRPQYGVLFANLDPGDGSAIIDRLRQGESDEAALAAPLQLCWGGDHAGACPA